MKQNLNILRGRPLRPVHSTSSGQAQGKLWLLLLAALFAWLVPQQAAADDGYETYVDQSYLYNVFVSGTNTVTITVPCYDQEGADGWIEDATLYASWEGQSELHLLDWGVGGSSISNDQSSCPVSFATQAPGYLRISSGVNTTSYYTVKPNEGSKKYNIVRNDDGCTFLANVIWVFPKELLGKTVKLRWRVKRTGTSRETVYLDEKFLNNPDPIKLPDANPVTPPFIALAVPSNDSKGRIEVPWTLIPDKISKLRYEYTDANNKLVSVDMPTTTNNGSIKLNAFEPHRNFRIIADYYEAQTIGEYLITDAASEPQDLNMIHAPHGLTVNPLGGATPKVEVKWNIGNTDNEDITEIDFFEIQRSLTGKEEDFVGIGQVPFARVGDAAQSVYTYVDSTFVDAIAESMLTDGYHLENLTYRVRRAMTQAWGWGLDNPCASTAKCVLDNLHLLCIPTYNAKQEDDFYHVRVTWNYANEPGGVWDDRAKMKIHITSTNLAGEVVEEKDVELNKEDRELCYKVIDLSRPCLKYDVKLYIDRGESPLNLYDKEKMEDYYFPIRSNADWNTFRDKVEAAKGEYDVNARLYADIPETDVFIGWGSNIAYRGVFDGNGHTVTVKAPFSERIMAPFRYVGNATIQNLHIAGKIETAERNVAGLIGLVKEGSTVVIENCRSSATINSSYNGAANNGGFVGRVSGANVTLRNCKFDGSIEGANSHENGGFIGWVAPNSNITIDNSLFDPDHISTKNTDCATWACVDGAEDANIKMNVMNSYATMEYSSLLTIRNASDWHRFAVMVNDAVNKYDVNAILAADITVSEHVGVTEGAYYRGTFEGNGHTLTFNKSGWTEKFIAPFRHVGTATIKNLHTVGTITSNQMYATGLVAQVVDGGALTVENCHSSMTLNNTGSGDLTSGGLVGRVSNASVVIRNSKFDGSFEGDNCYGNGGFISWVDEKSKATIVNCLFTPDHISTRFDKCRTWARQDDRGTVTVTNSHATKEYSVFIIKNAADWDTFREMIDTSSGAYYVDAALANDISITQTAAYSKIWTGTLNGNGHTITVNINGGQNGYIALFRITGNFTIKNLHLKGYIKGGEYLAGLVGRTYGDNNHIENCRVSATLDYYSTSNTEYVGGFVGFGDDKPIVITNSLFDGKIIGGDRLDYGAAFIGWQSKYGNPITGNAFNNNLENGSYEKTQKPIGVTLLGMNFYQSESPAWANGRYGSNNWTYHAVERRWGGILEMDCWKEANQVGDKSASDLVAQLGSSNWKVDGDVVVPKMFDSDGDNRWYNGQMPASEMVNILGKDYWEVVDGKAVPKMQSASAAITEDGALENLGTWTKVGDTVVPTTTTVAEPNYATITPPTLDDFYHTSTGKIDKELVVEKHQSSVVLTWNTDGNPIDYFTVMRREVLAQGYGAWEDVSPNIDQMTYEDKTVSPLKTYQYKVRATADCEGEHFTYTDSIVGACKNTGRLEGYVRFNDGTGIPGVTVNIDGGSVHTSVTTDESGHYVADELPYQGGASVTYQVTVGDKVETENPMTAVTFDSKTNDVTLREFTAINGKRFSGYVMYEGTHIPVKGANFLVNNQKIHNATGQLVETDEEGQFSFRVLPGNNNIQVVMDDHWFVNEGKYSNNFTGDVAGIQFQDGTKVKLIGRVVGGNDQGNLPLANNLSKNNLGDNLQMVLALEGDSKSWLVYDNQNPERTERTETFKHRGDGHQTTVKTSRKRMEVTPDQTTGEYQLLLPPVRWKVQQVYCQGYPTLYQEGQASEVIDLTDCLAPKDTTYVGSFMDVDGNTQSNPTASYNAIYNRIYHNPVELTYKQLSYDSFDYLGDKNYSANTMKGNKVQMPLAYKGADGQAVYTFGFPVFSLERKYYIQLQVAERYPYNNDLASEKIDYVKVGGGLATMHNGFKNGVKKDTLSLDDNGQCIFMLQADQVAQPVGVENALRTVTFSVEQDGTHFEAAPLHGYILNLYPIGKGKDLLTEGQPLLFDILRDPPGGYSSTTLAKGATLNNSYAMNLSMSGGLMFNFSLADKMTWFNGYTEGDVDFLLDSYDGEFDGVEHAAEKVNVTYTDLVFNYNGSKAWSHTMALSNAVSTSGDPSMVGADADLYIGMVQNVQVKPLSSICVITDSAYQARMAAGGIGQVNTTGDVAQYAKYGTLVHIAEGLDADGNKFHLVRDISLGYGPKLKSQFIYSQKQILEEIIPAKAKEIMNLMFLGTQEEAKRAANQSGKAVYRSLRLPTDSKFGYRNKDYNTDKQTADEYTHYVIVLPDGKTPADCPDEIAEKSEIIYAWTKMITQNEREKLNATDLVASYDIAGAAGVNYSEAFSSSYSNATTMYFPYGVQPDYFDMKGSGVGTTMASVVVNYLGGALFGYLESFKKLDPTVSGGGIKNNETSLKFDGTYFRWVLTPVLSSTTIGTNSVANEYNRSIAFTIAAAPTSRLAVDVYRVPMAEATKDKSKYDPEDVYSNFNFQDLNKETLERLRNEGNAPNHGEPCSFVFRTRGGYTSNPWEDERKTHFYNAGSILDERTLKIDNPTISLDKHSVSGVSINDPARFTIFLANESEKPEATQGLSVMQLFAADQANPNGAKISVNGQTLTTGGMTVSLVPGVTTQLEMEVRAGKGFDYEGLTIGLMSPSDAEHAIATTSFDVHFLREAGAVNISAPSDKWVLNTSAQQDPKRGWYLPVVISDFDRHQHNFDHIEFQYKETQRGDDAWVNLCSYYADSLLMANANGVCELIPENGNIVTEFYGEGWTIERSYDLRAVLFCRNGGTFLTTPSKIISGIKDTRRPQLFGTPEPKSGLLTLGDDIVFNFSEDIEYNNLSAISNFEVKGEVNNNDLSEMVSLQFEGKASVESEAKRNFSGKDFTVDLRIKPAETGRNMPLFSHGSSTDKLQLWLTSDMKLKAVINKQEYTSTDAIETGGFCHVGVAINQQDSTLRFYCDGKSIGGEKLKALYTGTGKLIFGRTNENDRMESTYYEGRMMEARLWYRALDVGVFKTYGLHRLTGYEKDLVDYYPMNEGFGDYAIDKTQGANAKLIGAAWAMPHGMSLHLDIDDHGLALTDDAIKRTKEQDYTLMFWFKTDRNGRGVLVSNGAGLKEEDNAENIFNIAFEADKLMYRSNGFATEVPGDWSDGQWHHYAMTVNRARNVANIYIDQTLRTTFGTDSLGGISGGHPMIGAAQYDVVDAKKTVTTIDTRNWLGGNIDELLFFAQALPETLIKTYSTKSPNGDEKGLITYLGFDHQERNQMNEIIMTPYAYSKKIYLDVNGNVVKQRDPVTNEFTNVPARDYVFVKPIDEIMQHIDANMAAPVVPYEEVTNLNFSFIGRGNQIMVEIDEPAVKLNHRNIYVTVRDVEDRYGNTMASPQTACYFVTNSSLQWLLNRYEHTMKYGTGEDEDQELTLPFYNNSAVNHTYTIENCPKWLKLDKYSDVLAPQNVDAITATVSKDLNVGTYNEILYLTDEEGISEPFYLTLTIEGEKPDWTEQVDRSLLENSMSIIGQVYLNDELDTDARDIVGVFDDHNVCHGFANISHDTQTGETKLYLTVYDSQASGRALNFRLWQYDTGRELVLTATPKVTFTKDAILGTDTPVRLDGGESFVQYFSLKKGWNWVSFNILSEKLFNLNDLLKSMSWTEGDIITDMSSGMTLNYENGNWLVAGSSKNVVISPKNAYAIKVQEDCAFPLTGTVIRNKDERTIKVNPGWNGIGYTPVVNLTVETALSDYFDYAESGDVIKSHTEFAYFTKTGNTGRWQGSLKYMKPGEGYMMLRKGTTEAKFAYPYYELGTNFGENFSQNARSFDVAEALNTMTVSATVVGFDPLPGDVLVAYSNGEKVGEAELTTFDAQFSSNGTLPTNRYYISIAGDVQSQIWYAIEREGEIVASTGEIMTYRTNAVIGSPEVPTSIDFAQVDYEEGQWYTISGLLLPKKPTQKGVYIFNGKKVVIK